MISDEQIEEAMDGRFDGIEAVTIVQELLELEEQRAFLCNRLIDMDCLLIAEQEGISCLPPQELITELREQIDKTLKTVKEYPK